jgi:hypothetical protein
VHLRYHSPSEYTHLSKEEKDELREWRLTSGTKSNKGKSSPKSGKEFRKPHVRFDQNKVIASAVEKKVAERMNAINQSKTKEDELEAYIMSIIKRHYRVQADVSLTDTPKWQSPPTTYRPQGNHQAGQKRTVLTPTGRPSLISDL